MIIDLLKAFLLGYLSSLFLSLLFFIPKKEIFWGGLAGGVAWLSFFLAQTWLGGMILPAFLSAFFAAFLSRFLSYRRRCPQTVFLISSITTLVPGGDIYLAMLSLIKGNMNDGLSLGFTAMQRTVCIVMAIAFVSVLPMSFALPKSPPPSPTRKSSPLKDFPNANS